MAKIVTKDELKAGHTFYVISNAHTIDMYRVIKRKGNKFAITNPDGPLTAELLNIILHQVTKFKSVRRTKAFAKQANIKLA